MYGSAYKIWDYNIGISITKIRNLADSIRNTYNGDVDDLLDYIEDNYIGRFSNAPRLPPLFPINLWNMFNRTDELPRTNNSVDGWHRSYNHGNG